MLPSHKAHHQFGRHGHWPLNEMPVDHDCLAWKIFWKHIQNPGSTCACVRVLMPQGQRPTAVRMRLRSARRLRWPIISRPVFAFLCALTPRGCSQVLHNRTFPQPHATSNKEGASLLPHRPLFGDLFLSSGDCARRGWGSARPREGEPRRSCLPQSRGVCSPRLTHQPAQCGKKNTSDGADTAN